MMGEGGNRFENDKKGAYPVLLSNSDTYRRSSMDLFKVQKRGVAGSVRSAGFLNGAADVRRHVPSHGFMEGGMTVSTGGVR